MPLEEIFLLTFFAYFTLVMLRIHKSGICLPWAPIEDLFYIVGVVFLVAVLDKYGRMRRAGRPGGSHGVRQSEVSPR